MKAVRIGVAGLGTVGGEVVRLLKKGKARFERRLGAELRVTAVADRRARQEARRLGLGASVARFTKPQELARAPLDIVVETLGGVDAPRSLILESLARGKHVVTANKRLLAERWDEISGAARRAGRRLFFEGSVAGGIPLLQALDQSLAANEIKRVLGILNGTTNFILSRMAHGSDFSGALRQAQALGLAERDPSLDLNGTDAADKVAVIASLITGKWVRPSAVSRTGIEGIEIEDLRFAIEELGRTARLLGVVESSAGGKLAAYVSPTLVPLKHPLASVHDEYNAVLVQTSSAGDLMFYGKGAGAGPAASAVVGDIFMLSQWVLSGSAINEIRDRPQFRRLKLGSVPNFATKSEYYLRVRVKDRPGALAKIAGALAASGVSIAQIHQASRGDWASIFLTTHAVDERSMAQARKAIAHLPGVAAGQVCMRLL